MLFVENVVINALQAVGHEWPVKENVTFSRQKKSGFAAE